MIRVLLPLLLLLFRTEGAGAQGTDYTSWFTGDTADVVTTPLNGLVLAGGGADNDDAMRWMLQRAAGGDVVVIRASQSDGYNDYFFEELGVTVNSVETIRFDGPAAAEEDYVIQQIRKAEVLFIAGGDQYDYYQYWKDTPVEDAINYLINEKQITVGGTSAGMAILGQAYYAPSDLGVYSEEALGDPYHPYLDVLGNGDFIQHPLMDRVITDTHFEDREREGRLFTFLARLTAETGQRVFGIAANDYTAVCIDENGIAHAYGEWPEFPEDHVTFLQANCLDDFTPETLTAGEPLTWLRSGAAVKVYRTPATVDGAHTFDLNDWQTASGGEWGNWYAVDGELEIVMGTSSQCDELILHTRETDPAAAQISAFPNPTRGPLEVQCNATDCTVERIIVHDARGGLVRSIDRPQGVISLSGLPAGLYQLQVFTTEGMAVRSVVRQ